MQIGERTGRGFHSPRLPCTLELEKVKLNGLCIMCDLSYHNLLKMEDQYNNSRMSLILAIGAVMDI